MNHSLVAALLLVTPCTLFAQETQHSMDHNSHNIAQGETVATDMVVALPATEQGQSAFAAIEEIVLALNADPNTDWSKVDISGLREHLVDMELVFTDAATQVREIENGFVFTVTGVGKTASAIQRMAFAHASIMNGVGDWAFRPVRHDAGVVLTVTTATDDMDKLRAIGFFGIMAMGMHHQDHHWMMATGINPHH